MKDIIAHLRETLIADLKTIKRCAEEYKNWNNVSEDYGGLNYTTFFLA